MEGLEKNFVSINKTTNNEIWSDLKTEIIRAKVLNLPFIIVLILRDDLSNRELRFLDNNLAERIMLADKLKVNILFCNIYGSINCLVPITNELLWIDIIGDTDLFVVYNRFYNKILSSDINEMLKLGIFISELTSNKLLIFPMKNIYKRNNENLQERITNLLSRWVNFQI